MAVMECEPVSAPVDDLVGAVRTLDKVFTRWQKSTDDDFPPDLVSAISAVCTIVTTGFPSDNRLVNLYMACIGLATAFQDVLTEERGSARRCVAAVEQVVKFLDNFETADEKPVRSVKSMLDEWKKEPLRYQWIAREFGEYDPDDDLWRGPFFNRNGIPQVDRIEKEAATPGSILGDGYVPQTQAMRNARIRSEALKSLSNIQAGLFRPEGGAKPEKASVLELLQDGQFPDVVSRIKGVPLSDVLQVAKDHNIRVQDRDSILSQAAAESHSDPIAESMGYVKPSYDPDDLDQFDDDDDEPFDVDTTDESLMGTVERESTDTGPITESELSDFVLTYLSENEGATVHDVLAAAVETTGKSVSRDMLSPIMKRVRESA